MNNSQLGISKREIRIKLHGMLEKRNGFRGLSRQVHFVARGKSLQSIQRRRGSLFNGSIELLNRGERLAQLLAQVRGRFAEHAQHLLFAFRFRLLPIQYVAGAGIDGIDCNDVVAAERCNRANQHGFQTLPLADFPRYVARHAGFRRTIHQAQRLLDTFIRENIQEGRLFELHGERLLERTIKHRIAGSVDEIRDQDCIFLSQW